MKIYETVIASRMAITFREWLQRLFGTVSHRPSDGDLQQELAHHLELAEEDLRKRGHTPAEAARLARARHGRSENALEKLKDQRGIPWFGKFTLDVTLGLRMLRKHWGLTLVGGFAMTVGFGIVTTIFMYFDVFVNSELPLDDGDRVVAIRIWAPERASYGEIAVQDFERWRIELRSLEQIGAFRETERRLVLSGELTERVPVFEMSAAGFRVARVSPVLGRFLLEEDERAGAEPVIVIGYEEWQARFDGDTDVLGQTVRLDDSVYTIVGVMPKDFGFPIVSSLWVPLQTESTGAFIAPDEGGMFARLAPGTTLETAQAELSSIRLLPSTSASASEPSEPLRPTVAPYVTISDGGPGERARDTFFARLLLLFMSFLLVPPCVIIAMLVYARTVTRQQEIAVRTALGASRARIVAQLFIEMLVLTSIAAILALVGVQVLVVYLERALLRSGDRLPFWIDPGVSLNTVFFAAGLALAAALIIGLLPALKTTFRFTHPGLSALDQRNRARLGPIWTALIIAQIAFSFAALPRATESAWGVLRAAVLGPGFAAEEYLTARLSMDVDGPSSIEGSGARNARFNDARDSLLRQLEADPRVFSRVTRASAVPGASMVPGEASWGRVEIEKESEFGSSSQRVKVETDWGFNLDMEVNPGLSLVYSIRIDDNYLDVFDVPILTGRNFEAGEFLGASQSAIVNETFVEKELQGISPLGLRIRYIAPRNAPEDVRSQFERWYEIVGVVADRPSNRHSGSVLHPADSAALNPTSISFRVGADAASLRTKLQEMATAHDPLLRVSEVRSLGELYDRQAVGNYFGGFSLIVSSLAVLLLSAAGLYALLSFTVNQRRREIGIRLALGARPSKLLAGIFGRALCQVSIGAAIGLVIAWLIETILPAYELDGWPVPGVLPGAAIFIVAIGAIAAYGPARRVLEVDPAEVLRDDG